MGLCLLSKQAPAGNLEVIQHFGAAQRDMRTGHFRDAIEEFKKVLALQPDLAEARVNLGLAYHAQGDYRRAVAELSQAEAERPNLLPASLFLGLSYMKLGSPGKAIAPLERALSIQPSNREARKALAAAEMSEGNYAKAAAQFQKLAATEPDKAEAWFALGHDYLQMAKQLTAELSLRFRNSAWSLRLAGDVLGERQLWNNAVLAYQKALQIEPAQPGLHAAMGNALLRAGRYREAEKEFEAELSRDPVAPRALLGVAEAHLVKGEAQPALDALSKVSKSVPEFLAQAEPGFPAVRVPSTLAGQMAAQLAGGPASPARDFLLAALYRISGDKRRASSEQLNFEKSIQPAVASSQAVAPSWAACGRHQEMACARFLSAQKQLSFADLLLLGRTLLTLHQEGAAAEAFSSAFAFDKGSPEAMYWLNRSYLWLAESCFAQLTASYPGSWRAHELKGEAFQLRQRDKEAIAEYQAAERLKPDSPEIHEALGEMFLDEQQMAEAKSELQAALRLDPSAARSLYLMGRLEVSEREPAKAIPYLKAALRHDPGLLEARPVLGKAYLHAGKPALAVSELERSAAMDRYGDLHFLLYQAYQQEGNPKLAARALARSQELRRQSALDDQAKIRAAYEE
jgi:tetratricopeptide (TPR) repeat protein